MIYRLSLIFSGESCKGSGQNGHQEACASAEKKTVSDLPAPSVGTRRRVWADRRQRHGRRDDMTSSGWSDVSLTTATDDDCDSSE